MVSTKQKTFLLSILLSLVSVSFISAMEPSVFQDAGGSSSKQNKKDDKKKNNKKKKKFKKGEDELTQQLLEQGRKKEKSQSDDESGSGSRSPRMGSENSGGGSTNDDAKLKDKTDINASSSKNINNEKDSIGLEGGEKDSTKTKGIGTTPGDSQPRSNRSQNLLSSDSSDDGDESETPPNTPKSSEKSNPSDAPVPPGQTPPVSSSSSSSLINVNDDEGDSSSLSSDSESSLSIVSDSDDTEGDGDTQPEVTVTTKKSTADIEIQSQLEDKKKKREGTTRSLLDDSNTEDDKKDDEEDGSDKEGDPEKEPLNSQSDKKDDHDDASDKDSTSKKGESEIITGKMPKKEKSSFGILPNDPHLRDTGLAGILKIGTYKLNQYAEKQKLSPEQQHKINLVKYLKHIGVVDQAATDNLILSAAQTILFYTREAELDPRYTNAAFIENFGRTGMAVMVNAAYPILFEKLNSIEKVKTNETVQKVKARYATMNPKVKVALETTARVSVEQGLWTLLKKVASFGGNDDDNSTE